MYPDDHNGIKISKKFISMVNDETPKKIVENLFSTLKYIEKNWENVSTFQQHEYTKEKEKLDNQFNVYNKQNKKGYSSDDILYFCNQHKIKCFGYDWKMQQFITN